MRIARQKACVVLAFVLGLPTLPVLSSADQAAEQIRKIDVASVAETGHVEPGLTVATSGQPDVAALERLSEAGYKAVVDLRGPGEHRGIDEQAVVEGLGMSYIPLPVSSGDDMSFETANALDAILQAAGGPVLVHCGSGNRAGALIALRASANGASPEEALAAGREAGLTRSESLVRAKLEAAEE